MAMVFKNAFVSLDTTQITAYVKSVTVNLSADAPEVTAMGDDSRAYKGGGLESWSADITFMGDFVALDAILNGAFNTTSALSVRPTTEAIGATNPSYGGVVILTEYPPVTGNVGDAMEINATFLGTGDCARATA